MLSKYVGTVTGSQVSKFANLVTIILVAYHTDQEPSVHDGVKTLHWQKPVSTRPV